MTGKRVVLHAAAALLAGCAPSRSMPTGFEVSAPLFAVSRQCGGQYGHQPWHHLSGAEEVFTPQRWTR